MKFFCPGDFNGTVLKGLNQLRKEEVLCDVTLNIGRRKVYAHRCVLAVSSAYFKSMFAGCFVESSMQEIDLTEVTDDVATLETILEYMYTGEIEINNRNVGILVKLSFFFLLQEVQQLCVDYMESTICLQFSLKYYLDAVAYNLSGIEKKTAPFLRRRFHDFMITDCETFQLSPEEVLHLLKKGYLKHCSTFHILQFALKWVGKGQTQEHVDVALYMVDLCVDLVNIDSKIEFDLLQKECENLVHLKTCDKIRKKVGTFLKKAKGTKTKDKSHELLDKDIGELERVLITLSPASCILKNYLENEINGNLGSPFATENKALLDICSYVPETKSWYHLARLFEGEHLPKFLTDFTAEVPYEMIIFRENIGFLKPYEKKLYLFNYRENVWKRIDAADVDVADADVGLYNSASLKHYRTFVLGGSNKIYLLVGKRIPLHDDYLSINFTEVVFCCYVLQDDGETWEFLFETPAASRLRYSAINTDEVVKMNVAVSQTTNEMLVVHYSGCWESVFVVDLDSDSPQPVTLLAEYKSHYNFDKYLLIESKDSFVLCSVKTLQTGGDDCIEILYEYKFKSSILRKVNEDSVIISSTENKLPGSLNMDLSKYPCGIKQQAGGGGSLWILEGDLGELSSLTEVSFQTDLEPVIKEHPPPPFPAVTRLYAGCVSKRLMSSCGKRIGHFVIKNKKITLYVNDSDKYI
ncbi:uncharacterized protein LOC123543188 [Mercenaria mercenaria]|uniref:uncharacterized protein LOC123543188 n=1 Tax=Mercenaria mercenaria TaxID=6596 RepID=UPI00234F3668|nr:uncharacterized protein LOC123543188 [Mercenaria mercenaria]